jgi:hypothetical protein
MACSLTNILINEMTIQIRIFFFYIILDLFSEVANNKNKFINAGSMQLVYIVLPAKGIKAFG